MQAMPHAPFAQGAVDSLRAALEAANAEARALVAAVDVRVVGVGVFGGIAGARGAAKLHLIGVAPHAWRRGVGAALALAITHSLRAEGARLLLAELPDDPVLSAYAAFLRACQFEEEARVPDFYRDGVALTFLRRPLAG